MVEGGHRVLTTIRRANTKWYKGSNLKMFADVANHPGNIRYPRAECNLETESLLMCFLVRLRCRYRHTRHQAQHRFLRDLTPREFARNHSIGASGRSSLAKRVKPPRQTGAPGF